MTSVDIPGNLIASFILGLRVWLWIEVPFYVLARNPKIIPGKTRRQNKYKFGTLLTDRMNWFILSPCNVQLTVTVEKLISRMKNRFMKLLKIHFWWPFSLFLLKKLKFFPSTRTTLF